MPPKILQLAFHYQSPEIGKLAISHHPARHFGLTIELCFRPTSTAKAKPTITLPILSLILLHCGLYGR